MAMAAVAARLKSVVWKGGKEKMSQQSWNWINLLVSCVLGRAFVGWSYITLLVWSGLYVAFIWAVRPQLLFRMYDYQIEDIQEYSERLDGDPDELRQFTILLTIPKSGPPPNYKKWYRSFIPAVKWYTLPHKRPRLVRSRKPDKYMGWFQAMLTPRQVEDMMKMPNFDEFYGEDLQDDQDL